MTPFATLSGPPVGCAQLSANLTYPATVAATSVTASRLPSPTGATPYVETKDRRGWASIAPRWLHQCQRRPQAAPQAPASLGQAVACAALARPHWATSRHRPPRPDVTLQLRRVGGARAPRRRLRHGRHAHPLGARPSAPAPAALSGTTPCSSAYPACSACGSTDPGCDPVCVR